MKFNREQTDGIYLIQRSESGRIGVLSPRQDDPRDEDRLVWFERSFIITPERLIPAWAPRDIQGLDQDALQPLYKMALEVVLIGTGNRMALPGPMQLQALVDLGIGYELMDSAAACRTYNILAGEGRGVAAAIMLG